MTAARTSACSGRSFRRAPGSRLVAPGLAHGRRRCQRPRPAPAPAASAHPPPRPRPRPGSAAFDPARQAGGRTHRARPARGRHRTARQVRRSALQAMQREVEPLATGPRDVIAELTPRAEALRMRLKELGPKPDEKAPPEGPSRSRGSARSARPSSTKYDDTLRLSRSLLVQAGADRRRSRTAGANSSPSACSKSTESLLSPRALVRGRPGPCRTICGRLRTSPATSAERAVQPARPASAPCRSRRILLALVLMLPVRRFALAFVKRDRLAGNPADCSAPRAAAVITLVSAVVPPLAAYPRSSDRAAWTCCRPALVPVCRRLSGGVAFVAFVRGLADGLLAPDRPARTGGCSTFRTTCPRTAAARHARRRPVGRQPDPGGASTRPSPPAPAHRRDRGRLRDPDRGHRGQCPSADPPRVTGDEAAFGPHVSDTAGFHGCDHAASAGCWRRRVIAAAVLGYVALAGSWQTRWCGHRCC